MIENSHIYLLPSTVFAYDSFRREASQTAVSYNAFGESASATNADGDISLYVNVLMKVLCAHVSRHMRRSMQLTYIVCRSKRVEIGLRKR